MGPYGTLLRDLVLHVLPVIPTPPFITDGGYFVARHNSKQQDRLGVVIKQQRVHWTGIDAKQVGGLIQYATCQALPEPRC